MRPYPLVLKTIVSSEHEIPFLHMQFTEAGSFVDSILVTEASFTHSGKPKELVFPSFKREFEDIYPNLSYLPFGEGLDYIENTQDSDGDHYNETLIRGAFARLTEVDPNALVLSTDADEVLYSSTFAKLRRHADRRRRVHQVFSLHQMFWRPQWLWTGIKFTAPNVTPFQLGNDTFPANWRYTGKEVRGRAGVHFSWCLPVEAMIQKLKAYSHSHDYSHFADEHLLSNARNSKEYPFEESTNLHVEELLPSDARLPASYLKWKHLIHPEVVSTLS